VNDLASLLTTGRKLSLAIESAHKLAVVLGIGRGLHGRNNLLDRLVILDGSQAAVTLTGLAAVALIGGHDASLELIFLDIKVVLDNEVSFCFQGQ
jgi:hypothetical protein